MAIRRVWHGWTGPDPTLAYVPDAARALLARWDGRAAHYGVRSACRTRW